MEEARFIFLDVFMSFDVSIMLASVLDKIAVTAKGIMQAPEVLATSIGDIIGGASKYVGTGIIIANEMNNILDERKEAADGKPLGFKDYAIATAASVVYGVVNRFTGGNAGLYETKKEVLTTLTDGLEVSNFYKVVNRAADYHNEQNSDSWERFFELTKLQYENNEDISEKCDLMCNMLMTKDKNMIEKVKEYISPPD